MTNIRFEKLTAALQNILSDQLVDINQALGEATAVVDSAKLLEVAGLLKTILNLDLIPLLISVG